MNQNSFLPLRNSRSASVFYSKSPLHDSVFLGNSFLLLADIAIATVILVKDWNHIPARIVFYIGLVMLGLVSMWRWALKSHKDTQTFLESPQFGKPDEAPLVDRALSVSANMTYLAMFYTFLLVGICLMALGEAL